MVCRRRPESVLVVVHTDDDRILLLKRILPFSFWQSVTGSLANGELPAEAARRELAEETGLGTEGRLIETGTVREFEIDPRWRGRYPPGVSRNTEHEFRYRLPRTVDVRLNAREHSASAWLDLDAAIERVWSWTNREALLALKARR